MTAIVVGQSRVDEPGLVAKANVPVRCFIECNVAKTFTNLWPELVSWENLVEAYRRCRRRKRFRLAAVRFDFQWEANVRQLQQELCEGTWRLGRYHNFRITDPKPRLISAAPFRDRVVHHAIVAVLEPIFERRFVFDSYACRRQKGTHRAIKRAQYYLRRHEWFLKTDIVKFFPNVDHEILYDQIASVVRDPQMMKLIGQILASGDGLLTSEAGPQWFRGDDLLAPLRPTGLPIGNLTSQFFANVLLDPIDHFVKETLRVPGYVRYADDLLLFADSKSELWEIHSQITNKLAEFRLRLHRHKTIVTRSRGGVKFLGFRVHSNQRRLTQEPIQRFNRRRRRWQWLARRGQLNVAQLKDSLRAWLAHAANANSRAICRSLLRRLKLRFR